MGDFDDAAADAAERASLRRVARRLLYKPLDSLLGQTVSFPAADQIESTLTAWLREGLPGWQTGPMEGSDPLLTLAKYGLLDVKFRVPAERLAGVAPGGIGLLRELGFIDEREDDEAAWPGFGYLQKLDKEIAASESAVLKLYLQDVAERDHDFARAERLLEDPSLVPFPVRCVIADACVANAGLVWLFKHFYL